MSNFSTFSKNLTNNAFTSAADSSECNDIYTLLQNKEWSVAVINWLITIIVKIIACPFTVLLNALVIAAVIKRPRLQTNPNILLACLAVTDVLTGLVVEPLLIALNIVTLQELQSTGDKLNSGCGLYVLVTGAFRFLSFSSLLHLTLVTIERFVAIKYTMRYVRVITYKNIKIAVVSVWILSAALELFRFAATTHSQATMYSSAVYATVIVCCLLFIICSYVTMFRETSRHRRQIAIRQTPQNEVRRFLSENKALKTTAYVVGAVLLCYLPLILFVFFIFQFKVLLHLIPIVRPWVPTLTALNSLLNPLIYCWRQKEMREFVFRNPFSFQSVGPG